uniref:Uncharacterized protein n=1 Tax=Strongyloides stercoralis TaxID=6248 RepID=A0A0K0DSX9_STRER
MLLLIWTVFVERILSKKKGRFCFGLKNDGKYQYRYMTKKVNIISVNRKEELIDWLNKRKPKFDNIIYINCSNTESHPLSSLNLKINEIV